MKISNRILVPAFLLVALVAVAGCKKKQPLPPPQQTAPPAAAPAPTAQLTATPTVISAGDQVQLSWKTTDAASVSIDGIGDVPSSGVRTVTPSFTGFGEAEAALAELEAGCHQLARRRAW